MPWEERDACVGGLRGDGVPLSTHLPGSQVTSYGGELRFTVTQRPQPGSAPLHGQPLVVVQGNGIVLEHHTSREPGPGQPHAFTVPFREVSHLAGPCLGGVGPWGARGRATCPFLDSKPGSGLTASRPRGSTC